MPFRIRRGAWITAAAVLAAYIGLGFPMAHQGTAEMWVYRLGLAAGTVIPVAFVIIYTTFGLWSRTIEAKWWRTQLGTAEVAAALSLIPAFGPLAWTFWKDNGMLTPSWCAWAEVAGPVVTALAWAWLCIIWLRVHAIAARQAEVPDREVTR